MCAIIKKYRPQLACSKDTDKIVLYEKMLKKSIDENILKSEVLKYSSRISTKRILDLDQFEFPELTDEYIQSITFGVYQLKQSISYTLEHINKNGDYVFEFFEDDFNLIRVKINSRFTSQSKHNTWVKYSLESKQEPILGWYCDCKSGSRVF